MEPQPILQKAVKEVLKKRQNNGYYTDAHIIAAQIGKRIELKGYASVQSIINVILSYTFTNNLDKDTEAIYNGINLSIYG